MKIIRKKQKVFAEDAPVNLNIAQFGSLKEGSPNYSSDPDIIQALTAYGQGWNGALAASGAPALQDMNALQYLFSRQIAYLLQAGIPEYDSATTYYIGSLVNDGTGIVYMSLLDNNTGQALSDSTKWFIYKSSKVVETSIGYPVINSDWLIRVTGSSTVTITLPAAASSNRGRELIVKNAMGGGTLSVVATPSLIDGNASVSLTLNSAYLFVSNGTSWDITSLYGNAPTASKLYTARNINGVSFDGSADITLPLETTHFSPASNAYNLSWSSIIVRGNRIVASAYPGFFYVSTDYGLTWTSKGQSRSWKRIASDTAGTKLVAVAASSYIYVSADAGDTWTEKTTYGPYGWTSVASSSDGVNLAACAAGSYVWTSTDSGATWTARTGSGSRSWYCIASNSTGSKLIAAVNNGYIFRSSDYGVTWTQCTGTGNYFWGLGAVASSADGVTLIAAPEGGWLYMSTDSGVTWTPKVKAGHRTWGHVACSADGTKIVASAVGDYIYYSKDSGTTWAAYTGAGMRTWRSVAMDGNNVVAGVDNNRIYVSY